MRHLLGSVLEDRVLALICPFLLSDWTVALLDHPVNLRMLTVHKKGSKETEAQIFPNPMECHSVLCCLFQISQMQERNILSKSLLVDASLLTMLHGIIYAGPEINSFEWCEVKIGDRSVRNND